MTPKIKHIIIFVSIGLALVLGYVFFLKPAPEQPALTSDTGTTTTTDVTTNSTTDANAAITQNFLSLLLSVKSITLDDSIFSTPAFNSLQDSTIVLTPDGTQGRPNPFAPIGADSIATAPASTAPAVSTTTGGEVLLAPAQIDTTPPTPPVKTVPKAPTKTTKTGTTTK